MYVDYICIHRIVSYTGFMECEYITLHYITNPFMMLLHSYKYLAADHGGHAVLQLVITVFYPWDAGIMGSDA
jgi:hypothetical protein